MKSIRNTVLRIIGGSLRVHTPISKHVSSISNLYHLPFYPLRLQLYTFCHLGILVLEATESGVLADRVAPLEVTVPLWDKEREREIRMRERQAWDTASNAYSWRFT